jgi:hypothetical protein
VADQPPQRLSLDVSEVRDRTRLRLIAAVPALVGGAWLAWISEGWFLRVLAATGLLFATLWVALAQRSARQLARADEHYLDIGDLALQVRTGSQRRMLAWSDVEAVEIDEDRLVVLLRIRGAAPLAIEPMYGGLTLSELGMTLQRARQTADQAAGSSALSTGTEATDVGAGATPGMRSPQS